MINKKTNDQFLILFIYQKLKFHFSTFLHQEKILFDLPTPIIDFNPKTTYSKILENIYFSNLTTNQQMHLTNNHSSFLHHFLINNWNKISNGVFCLRPVFYKNFIPQNDLVVQEIFFIEIKIKKIKSVHEIAANFFDDILSCIFNFIEIQEIEFGDHWLKVFKQLKSLLKSKIIIGSSKNQFGSIKFGEHKKLFSNENFLTQELFFTKENQCDNFFYLEVKSFDAKPWILATCHYNQESINKIKIISLSATLNLTILLAFLCSQKSKTDLNFLYLTNYVI